MSRLLALFAAERRELLAATAVHLDLVLEAIALAVLIGVPLGIAASRSKLLERLALGAANVFQTVPSLALLGFLLIAFGGIGKPPALAALVLYALLPIVKNTVLGLRSVDRGVAEAALGMGMTAWQRLWLVELPLALPILLGGVRVATVAAVGMTTIAAVIGAGGLGTFIFSGVQLFDYGRILLGSIPAAGLALACDAALGELERVLAPAARRRPWRDGLALLAVGLLLGLACWGFWRESIGRASGRTVVVGSKDSAEQILLGHMLADLIEARTELRVERRLGLGGTLVCYEAVRGDGSGLDVYVEYTGTALTAILKQPPRNDPPAVLRAVREACGRDGVAVLDPLGFENTFALVMRRDRAGQLGIATISDLAAHLDSLRIGFGPEFGKRADGFPGLRRAYGLDFQLPPREMDRNLLYEAVARGAVDVGVGDSTDGRIATLDLVILSDDRRYFPPYEAVPLANAASLERHPGLRDALAALSGQVDTRTMQQLNRAVDTDRRPPGEVARTFLRERGLIPADRP